MSEDSELDKLKRQRLAEMQRALEAKQSRTESLGKTPDPKQVFQKVFVGRAWEVYNATMHQYPQIARQLFEELAELVQGGHVRGPITGEQLFGLVRQIGLDVRLETKIQVLERGELKSIADKFRGD